MNEMFEPGQWFQHKDGGIYEFVRVVRYSDRPTQGVEYIHRWPFELSHWIRPIEEWTSDRFKPISSVDAFEFTKNFGSAEDGQAYVKANKTRRKG